MKYYSFILIVYLLSTVVLKAENGHGLWLRNKYTGKVNIVSSKNSSTLKLAKYELQNNWHGVDGAKIRLIVKRDKRIEQDGFELGDGYIKSNSELGILFGAYELLRQQQVGLTVDFKIYNPSYQRRILNHWDNLDGSVEQGFAGASIFWKSGTDSLKVTQEDLQLWREYARANASIGLNGAVLNNVNASPKMLQADILERAKSIADVLRPYGQKVYLSINFASPSIIGGLETADPLNQEVISWWKAKVKVIYDLIPDFGGFLVKANSEGRPGPQDYGRTHVDGANMLARALEPYGGIVMWRAFVYSPDEDDRAKQAFSEFYPFDGKFLENVIIQSKNGPIDFQPREPFNPLFGAMKKTPVMPELQITQEYLGQGVHLVYLATMWEEFLQTDTYQEGKNSTVARVTDGSVFENQPTLLAGVSGIGKVDNWYGHDFSQSNWYAFGRLAWNNHLSSEKIADEWIKLTFRPDINEKASYSEEWKQNFLNPIKEMMLESREAAVNYMMPLGLHHIFAPFWGRHYGPSPWWDGEGVDWEVRKDWTSVYYHQADSIGVGFDRSLSGSNAVAQYSDPLQESYGNIDTCPEELLLWFHHVPWDYKLKNGNSLWQELCYRYDKGVNEVRSYQMTWDSVHTYVDQERFALVQRLLRHQSENAEIWKAACLLYFQQFSNQQIPYGIERPKYNLDEIVKYRYGQHRIRNKYFCE